MKKSSQPLSKPISELSLEDFLTHPIWTWADEEDERAVIPLEDVYEGHDALFIVANFFSERRVQDSGLYRCSGTRFLFILRCIGWKNNRLFDIPLQRALRKLINANRLEAELSKEAKDIFPIRYEAAFPPDKRMTGYIENFLV